MIDKATEAVSPLLAPLCAFAGAVLMLLFRKEMEARRMLVAVLSGPLFAWAGAPTVLAWLASMWSWMPRDGQAHALVGCLIGLLAINIVAFIAHAGQRAERIDPLNPGRGDSDAR